MNIRISNIQALKFILFLSFSSNILIFAACKLSEMHSSAESRQLDL